jgi:hypothetical protein
VVEAARRQNMPNLERTFLLNIAMDLCTDPVKFCEIGPHAMVGCR